MPETPLILAVDDEPLNLDILNFYLTEAGFNVITADDGDTALAALEKHSGIEVIVLDRMMPRMNGMEVLERLRERKAWKDIPVIMQTAAAGSQQVLEGIRAGVYYYLTKPYEDTILVSIVRAAFDDARARREMSKEVKLHRRVLGLMEEGRFRFRTLEEMRNLAYFLANCFPEPETAVFGLSELMLNAVEHGNLGITYAEKTQLLLAGRWRQEVERRLALPELSERCALLEYTHDRQEITVRIRDGGAGFDWQHYLNISPARVTDPHGRGIATARMLSFSSVEYQGCGNEVVARLRLPHDTA